MANKFSVDLEVDGLTETLDRLRTFDRKAYDGMTAELEAAAGDIADEARANTPSGNALRNWGTWNSATVARKSKGITTISKRSKMRPIGYDGAAARAGIQPKVAGKFRKGRRLSTIVQVRQMNPGGAIWALAGSDNTDWGATGGSGLFRQHLNNKFGAGPWPRALTPAWRNHKDAAADRIDELIGKYADEASSTPMAA